MAVNLSSVTSAMQSDTKAYASQLDGLESKDGGADGGLTDLAIAKMKLEMGMQQSSELSSMFSNIIKMMHDANMAIINNIR